MFYNNLAALLFEDNYAMLVEGSWWVCCEKESVSSIHTKQTFYLLSYEIGEVNIVSTSSSEQGTPSYVESIGKAVCSPTVSKCGYCLLFVLKYYPSIYYC